MRPAGPLLLLLVASPAWSTADEPAVANPSRTSPRLSREIRAPLPKFIPPTAPSPGTGPVAAPFMFPDPDLLVLPKMVITEKRPPGNDPDVWLTNRVIQHKAMSAYRDSMTDLEWALNSWFIPLFSAPPSVRARQYYEGRKVRAEIDRLSNIIKTVGLSDPKEAAKLRAAMDPKKLRKDD